MFEVGQKIKIIDAASMGMKTFRNGLTYIVDRIILDGAVLLDTPALVVEEEWIEDGYAEIVEEEE